MLAVNLVADFVGLNVFKSVYTIVATNIFPVIAGIIIAYIPLNKYCPYNKIETVYPAMEDMLM